MLATELPGQAAARPLRAVPRPRRGRRGGSERPLHRAPRPGAVRRPLRAASLARRRQPRAAERERRVVVVRGGRRPRRRRPSSNAARARTDAAVRAFRANEQAFADAGLSPAAGARARRPTNQGLDGIPARCGARSTPATVDAATTRNFFLDVDEQLLDFGERVARDLASADVAASLTRVFALERAQHELAREASVYISVLASGGAERLQRVDRRADRGRAATAHLFANAATDRASSSRLSRSVMGAPAGAGAAARGVPDRAARRRPSTTSQYQQQSQQPRPGDRRGRTR